jgi:hypothetical protein
MGVKGGIMALNEATKAEEFYNALIKENREMKNEIAVKDGTLERLEKQIKEQTALLKQLEPFRELTRHIPAKWTVDITDPVLITAMRQVIIRDVGRIADPFSQKTEEGKAKACKQADRLITGAIRYVFSKPALLQDMMAREKLSIPRALDQKEEDQD